MEFNLISVFASVCVCAHCVRILKFTIGRLFLNLPNWRLPTRATMTMINNSWVSDGGVSTTTHKCAYPFWLSHVFTWRQLLCTFMILYHFHHTIELRSQAAQFWYPIILYDKRIIQYSFCHEWVSQRKWCVSHFTSKIMDWARFHCLLSYL